MPGLYLEHFDFIAMRVGYFDGVARDRAVVPLGVTEVFEGKYGLGHADIQWKTAEMKQSAKRRSLN